jgi:hypothetical protein
MPNGIVEDTNPVVNDDTMGVVEKWLHIDDFSPGCWDGSFVATLEPKMDAPIGAADAGGTWCCASLANGALAPLPGLTQAYSYAPAFPGTATKMFITGFIVNPGLNADGFNEILILMEADDGTDHYALGWSEVPGGGGSNVFLNTTNPTTGPGIFGSPYPAFTRLVTGGPAAGTSAPPRLVFPQAISTDSHGNNGHLYAYPSQASPTTFSVDDMVVPGTSGITGQVITYGNRILVLSGITYSWPSGGGINTNETINFTDPPQSLTYGNQETILAAEEPWGYGAWGSVSIGELLLVKKVGGAVVLNGDIDSPNSVIPLPGIQSTGDMVGRADASSIGVVYCSQNQGAWAWNGGNTAEKISMQLRDDFFDAQTPAQINSNNYGFYVAHWQDYILFSNNYLLDADTEAWWVLYPNAEQGNGTVPGHTLFWFSPGAFGNQMYAAPLVITDSDKNWYYEFDNTVPAGHFQWTSLPIHLEQPSSSRTIDIRQILLRVSSPDGTTSGSVSITLNGAGYSTHDAASTSIGPEPTLFRFNTGQECLGLTDLQFTINSDNPGFAAPIVHSVEFGFNVRNLVPSVN